MSISSKLISLANIKENIRQSIINKGVDTPAETPFSQYHNYIDGIQSGGGEYEGDGTGLWILTNDIPQVQTYNIVKNDPEINNFLPVILYNGNGADGTFNNVFTNSANASASDSYSIYVPSRAVDGNITTFWYTRAANPQWWQYDCGAGNEQPCCGIRIYCGSVTYSNITFSAYASDDLNTWINYGSFGLIASAVGWEEFSLFSNKNYRYHRFVILASGHNYKYLYEIEMSNVLVGDGNKPYRCETYDNNEIAHNYFQRSGYVFTGWNTNEDGSGTSYSPEDNINLTEISITLYAQWEVE